MQLNDMLGENSPIHSSHRIMAALTSTPIMPTGKEDSEWAAQPRVNKEFEWMNASNKHLVYSIEF